MERMNKMQFSTRALHIVKGQKLWVAIVCLLLGFFVYGELTGTRLFNSASTDTWVPQGAGMHNSINHK